MPQNMEDHLVDDFNQRSKSLKHGSSQLQAFLNFR